MPLEKEQGLFSFVVSLFAAHSGVKNEWKEWKSTATAAKLGRQFRAIWAPSGSSNKKRGPFPTRMRFHHLDLDIDSPSSRAKWANTW